MDKKTTKDKDVEDGLVVDRQKTIKFNIQPENDMELYPVPQRLKSNGMASGTEADEVSYGDSSFYDGSSYDAVLTKVKSIFTVAESFKVHKFDPEKVAESGYIHASKVAMESYYTYTVWRGTRFQSLKTELKFLNEHAILNRRSVFAGYAIQFALILFAVGANLFYLHLISGLCAKEIGILKETCDSALNVTRKDRVYAVTLSVAAFALIMAIVGIFSQCYIHRSNRIANKAWAIAVAWAVYSIELVGICLLSVYIQDGDAFWNMKMSTTFTAIFVIGVLFNGLLFYQIILLSVVSLSVFYGVTIPIAAGLVQKIADPYVPEDLTTGDLIEYILYFGSAPLTAAFCVIALVSSYLSEFSFRMRFLERLLITHQQNNVIYEKTKNEEMQRTFLENMLPATVVDDLEGISYSIQAFEKLSKRCLGVAILFADIAGFTSFATQVDSSIVMRFLNELFLHFDDLSDQYNVYKVETVGDCYVAAVGVVTGQIISTEMDEDDLENSKILNASKANTEDMVGFGKAMIAVSRLVMKPKVNSPALMRVGIHTGPCMSGIVGTRNLRYCLFGDTMNTAARMEQTGVVDAIHVSDVVADLVPDEPWESRGSVTVKGKGAMQTYLLEMEM